MHSRRIPKAIFLLCAIAVASILSPSLHASPPPRVLAFYYSWYDQNTWSPNVVSDLPSRPYNSDDPAVIARHIQQAQSAGIDAFVSSWIGTNNPTDWNFKTLLGLARSANFAATIDFEVQHFGTVDQVVAALAYVRDSLMSQPAFLRENGRPILFFWREQNFSQNDWATIRSQVDPDHQQIWIAEGIDISYERVFDGHHLYSIAWSSNPSATLSDWSARVRRAGGNKLWVATVMPGYDDTRTDRPDRFARPRDSGSFYRSTWQAAINSQPDYIIVTSFNEWIEGTMIEPSVSYGNLYLDLTRQFAAQFKSGTHTPSSPVTLNTAPSPPEPALDSSWRHTTDPLRVRAGPGTEYTTLGRLPANRAVKILGRTDDGEWLQIPFPIPDTPGWISTEFVAPQTQLDSFPILLYLGTDSQPVQPSGDVTNSTHDWGHRYRD